MAKSAVDPCMEIVSEFKLCTDPDRALWSKALPKLADDPDNLAAAWLAKPPTPTCTQKSYLHSLHFAVENLRQ